MDKQTVKEIVKEMILSGEIKLSTSSREVYSNEGRFYGDEEALVLAVERDDGNMDWDSVKEVKQEYGKGVVLNEIEITGW